MLQKEQFAIGNKRLKRLHPTKEALRQHTLRAAFQSGHVWWQSREAEPAYTCPKEWGWQKTDSHWWPNWSTLDELCKSCQELVKCRCTKGCLRACSCRKAQLKCTILCYYQGECPEYICKLIPKITSETKPNVIFMEHSGHLGKWRLLIIIFDFSKFNLHNLSYCGQKHINRQQNCKDWLIFNFRKYNGGHLGKWLLRVTMLDFRNYKLNIQL